MNGQFVSVKNSQKWKASYSVERADNFHNYHLLNF